MRTPDQIIGSSNDPYMLRWFIRRSREKGNIYLHNILRDDEDTYHDHPWWSVSIPLWGKLIEYRPGKRPRRLWPLVPYFRRADQLHYLEVGSKRGKEESPGNIWSLFITGPKIRNWGFMTDGGWVHWENYHENF